MKENNYGRVWKEYTGLNMPKLVGMERKATVILTCDVWAAGVQATWNVDTEATTVELVHRKLSGPLPKVAHPYPLTYPVLLHYMHDTVLPAHT